MKHTFTHLSLVLTIFALLGCKQEPKQAVKAVEAPEITETKSIALLVGTYTTATSEGIYRMQFHPETEVLSDLELVARTENPSYLQISKDRSTVYTVNENNPGTISSLKWNGDRTQLEPVAQTSSEGAHPCYIALNPLENLVAVGNYSTGNIAVYKVDGQANFPGSPQTRQHKGSGPVKPSQDGPRAHFTAFDAEGGHLYVVDLGIDQVLSYPVDTQGNLGDAQIVLQLDKGDGPRHMVFHPTMDLVFVVNELSSTVVSARRDTATGNLQIVDKRSTLPEGYAEKSYCADIHISPNGKFLYASNRGHNSIAIFKVSETGALELLGTEDVRGDWPRNFSLSPSGEHLLVANQRSNNITVFGVDLETGLLHYTGQQLALDQPACIRF